jgi:hypothetical protein
MTDTTTGRRSAGIAWHDRYERSLPTPRRGARWRWTAPHCTQAGNGEPATAGGSRTMLSGRVASVRGHTLVVVPERTGTAVRVVETASTSYTTLGRDRRSTAGPAATGPAASGTAASSAAAVQAGDFVGVRGVANADGTVTATSMTVFTTPPFG